MTMRSSFYPILGAYTWGWMGDLIDGFSIVMTVAGVCTSLGLGTIQIVTGLQRLGWVDADLEDLREFTLPSFGLSLRAQLLVSCLEFTWASRLLLSLHSVSVC